jgi:hypothetical protein
MKVTRADKIFAQSSHDAALEFDPYRAVELDKRCFPFVEIDPIELLTRVKSSSLEVADLFSVQSCTVRRNLSFESALSSEELPFYESVPIDCLYERIRGGEYLDGYSISKDVIIIVLGTDETWIVGEEYIWREIESCARDLISLSLSNIRDIGASDRFLNFSTYDL